MRQIHITWVHKADPNRAAMLSLGEVHDADPSLSDEENYIEALGACDYIADLYGIDREMYTPAIEVITDV